MGGWLKRVINLNSVVGGFGGGGTPGPIPNPEAKPSSADGTALDRVWESRTPPSNHSRRALRHRRALRRVEWWSVHVSIGGGSGVATQRPTRRSQSRGVATRRPAERLRSQASARR